jgi:hypothetical protein
MHRFLVIIEVNIVLEDKSTSAFEFVVSNSQMRLPKMHISTAFREKVLITRRARKSFSCFSHLVRLHMTLHLCFFERFVPAQIATEAPVFLLQVRNEFLKGKPDQLLSLEDKFQSLTRFGLENIAVPLFGVGFLLNFRFVGGGTANSSSFLMTLRCLG